MFLLPIMWSNQCRSNSSTKKKKQEEEEEGNQEMITNALRTLVNNPFKENFYRKRKKKVINVLTAFFIPHKSDIKTFLKWIVN